MVEYDRSLIQEFAQRLYRQAKNIIAKSTIIGLIVGTGFGLGIANSLPDSSAMIVVPICAIILGALGYWAGVQRSFALRLAAQTALCQMMIEANTSSARQSGALMDVQIRPTTQTPAPRAISAVSTTQAVR